MKSVWNSVAAVLSALFVAVPTFAQVHPLPKSASQPPVICTGCPGTNRHLELNDGLPTAGFSLPVAAHAGRLVDSSSTRDFQNVGIRTVRAGKVLIAPTQRGSAPPRVYAALGEAIGAYSLSTFYTSTLPAGTVPVDKINTGWSYRFRTLPLERVAMPDAFVYPEATMSGWETVIQDGQKRLGDFDVDDRGYLYAAYITFGWGILQDDGRGAGAHLPKVAQIVNESSSVVPRVIFSLKTGGRYYAAVASDYERGLAIYDVTNPSAPASPIRRSTKEWSIMRWAKHDASGRLAYVDHNFKVHVYDYGAFVRGEAPIATYTAPTGKTFADVSFDENGTLWMAESALNGLTSHQLWRATPSGSSYTVQTFSPYGDNFRPDLLDASAGFVFVAGTGQRDGGEWGVEARILKIENGVPRLLDDGNFFRRYYNYSLPGQAMPQTVALYTPAIKGVKVHRHNGKTYAFYNIHGMGDVFELEGSDGVAVTMNNTSFGTVNPYAKPTQPGPFVGDPVRFKALSSNPAAQFQVIWDFGNPESGWASNSMESALNVEVDHQYVGLDTAAKITAPKSVTATSKSDSSVVGVLPLTLKVPVPRVGVTGRATPLTGAATIDVVAGDLFNDASDGSVESHVSTWTIDGAPAVTETGGTTPAAPNVRVRVGAIGGPRTLSFKASYGAPQPYETTLSGITYTVRPFLVALKPPVKSGTNVVFSADGRATSDTSILSATQWTVTWRLNGVVQQTGAAAVGTIPTLTVPQTAVGAGSIVEVEVSVDGLTGDAAQYATHKSSTTLSSPDPEIVLPSGGCTALAPCTVTAKSISNASTAEWTFAWTIKNSGGTTVKTQTGTSSSVTHTFGEQGTYTVSLVATHSVFDIAATPKSLSVAAPACAAPPPQSNLSITASCTTNCGVGQTIAFSLGTWNTPLQDCDVVTWNFGDGSATKTGQDTTHAFSTNGTFTVRATVSNSSGSPSVFTTTTVQVGTVTTCAAPTSVSITYSGSKGCAPGVACKTGESVTFVARKNGAALQSCDSVSWTFGNGATSTTKTPTIVYNNTGTFTVTASVTAGTSGTMQGSTSVAVVQDTQACGAPPAQSNVTIGYYGRTSGCTATNGVLCRIGETIEFYGSAFGYSFQACDVFEWNFGDNSALSSQREPTHVFPSTGISFAVKLRIHNTTNSTGTTFTQGVLFQSDTPVKPVPQLSYSGFPAKGSKGIPVRFTVQSNMETTTGWLWSFGDGTGNDSSQASKVGSSNTIEHTFANTGNYTVTVSARNSEDSATAPVGLVTASIAVDETPEYRYLVVAGHITGQNNTAWRTDVQVYNPDPNVSASNPLRLTTEFKGTQKTLEIPNSTHIYQDFMRELISGDDQGPVILTARTQHAPQIWTRTYNQTENGTFGQFIPAVRLDSGGGGAIGEGKYYLAGLRQDSRFRTNLGFVNPTSQTVNATVSVFDENRFQVGQFTVQLPPYQLDQFPVNHAKGVPGLSDKPFSLEIDVPAGQWLVAYASYIDSQSNDPVYVQAIRESELSHEDYRYSVIPGVGHVGDWRSDVTIFNPATQTIAVDLAYHDGTGAKVGQAQNVVIRAGEFVQFTDILKDGVLGGALPDSLGLLRVTVPGTLLTPRFPMTFARTYNDNGSGVTFGQGVAGFAIDRANVKPGKPALVPGIRSNAGYYTNFGLINVSNVDVVATVKVLNPVTGAETPIFQQTLTPYQSIVGPANINDLQMETASLKIEVSAGGVWAFASIIDKGTLDPEYVPATPLVP